MNKILEIKFGSHLYGTNTPNSDIDIKGIYLPTAREIVLNNYKKTITTNRPKNVCERNTKDDIDTEFFSLDRYLEFLMAGQTVALDMLFAPQHMYTFMKMGDLGNVLMDEIYDNREKLLTRNVLAFIGYAKQQSARYGIKGSRMDALKRTKALLDSLPESSYTKLSVYEEQIKNLVNETKELISLEKTPLIETVLLKGPKGLIDAPHLRVNGRSIAFHSTVKYAKEIVGKMLDNYGLRAHKAHLAQGIDFKALSHCIRINSEAIELLSTGNIGFPRPDKELLIKIKLGQMPYEEIAALIEQGLVDVYAAHDKSTLRDEPDQKWANDFIYDVYSKIVKNDR